ncbi:MAG: nucleotidyl transferase AbiEii/AbiGii toxin family protein [Phycisphaerae bacterium]
MVTIPSDFLEFFALLNAHDVQYVVVGGYAVAVHGAPRFTGDIDVFVGTDGDNAIHLVQALERFGFAELGISESDFVAPEQVIQIGVPPMRIDLRRNKAASGRAKDRADLEALGDT